MFIVSVSKCNRFWYISLLSCHIVILIYSNQFFSWFIGMFYIQDHIICKQRNFYFFLSDLNVFHFFCLASLLWLVKCWIEMLRVHLVLYLFPDIRGKTSSRSPISMMLAVGSSDAPYQVEEVPFCSQMLLIRVRKFHSVPSFLSVFLVKGCWSAYMEIIMWLLSFILLIWCSPLIDFQMFKQPHVVG